MGFYFENFNFGDADSDYGVIIMSIGIDGLVDVGSCEKYANNLFNFIKSGFFIEGDFSLYDRFEKSLKALNKELLKLSLTQRRKLSISIVAIKGSELHASRIGDSEIYLFKKNELTSISDDLNDSMSKNEVPFKDFGTSDVDSGDIYIFSAKRLQRNMTKKDIAYAVKSFELSDALNKIKEMQEKSSKNAIFLIESKVENKIQKIMSKRRSKIRFSPKWKKARIFLVDLKRNLSKNNLVLAIVLAVIFLIVVLIFIDGENDATVQTVKVEVEKIEYSIDVLTNKIRIDNDPTKRKSYFIELDKIDKQLLDLEDNKFSHRKILDLKARSLAQREILDKVEKVSEESVNLKSDLSKKTTGFSARGFIVYDKKIMVFDKNSSYDVFSNDTSGPNVISKDEDIKFGTFLNKSNDKSIFYTKIRNVIEYQNKNENFMKTDNSKVPWYSAVAIQSYKGNRIYLLSPTTNQIYKYKRKNDTQYMLESAEYNKNSDLKNAVDFVIDDNIWVLNKDGSVIKMLSGKKQEFDLKNVPSGKITNAKKIFTINNSSSGSLFITDPDKNRVLRFDKQRGNFIRQYVFDFLDNGDKIVDAKTDANEQFLYVLTKTKLYSKEL